VFSTLHFFQPSTFRFRVNQALLDDFFMRRYKEKCRFSWFFS